MNIDTDPKKIDELLSRGTEDIIDKEHLRAALLSGRQLRIKLGIDPTGPNIHLGRATILFKLRDFQKLGHKIVLIIGNFTALVGDASDKDSRRPVITQEKIDENLKDYLFQIGKILDIENEKIFEKHYNMEWFGKMKLEDILKISMNFTAQQMIQRRNFKERWEDGKEIGVHELLYPMLQGFDSTVIKSDVELGGFDQLFNLKTGRDLQKIYGQEPQDVMTFKMIYGLDGRKMSTSWGNVINITDEPNDMFGKLMSLRDELIIEYFICCTRLAMDEINGYKEKLGNKEINPKEIKKILAKAVVESFYPKEVADNAKKEWENQFEEKELPAGIEEVELTENVFNIVELLLKVGLFKTKGEARRVIEQGGIKIIKGSAVEIIKNWQEEIRVEKGMIIQSGKRYFKKII